MTTCGLPQLTSHHLRIEVRAQTHIAFGRQPGGQLRGALFGVLRHHYCPAPDDPDPGHSAICPVCWLLAREDAGWWRGNTPVRPYTIEPPLPDPHNGRPPFHYRPGETFTFGITLFGTAVNLLPYLILAIPEMGRVGAGRRLPQNKGHRGRFTLVNIRCIHPLTGEEQLLLGEGGSTVQIPTLPVATADIQEAADRMLARINGRVRLHFLTPTRIIARGRQRIRRPLFRPLFGRLVDRIEGLAREYGDIGEIDVKPALEAAEHVELICEDTVWVDLSSHSSRTGRSTPIGGFMGYATYMTKDWAPLLPWLIWGTLTHVGKNAVKGDGWYEVSG